MARNHYLFEFHPEAIREARNATEWYAERSLAASLKFEEELALAEQEIVRHPNRWANYLYGTRRYLLSSFPFGFVYKIHGDAIKGIAVAHLHRSPGYWRERLGP